MLRKINIKPTFYYISQLLLFVNSKYQQNGCRQSAAALTYMSLFAIVPLMTVTYSMFSLIPAFQGVGEQLESLIFRYALPDAGSEIQQYLQDFSRQARQLTPAGISILFLTALLLLKNMEKTLNRIWGVKENRKGIASFLLYWAVLSLGPILLGIGLMMSTYLLSIRLIVTELDYFGVTHIIFKYFPLILSTTAFTLIFAAVPNCRVPIKHALIGGFATAITFELAKFIFSLLVKFSSYHFIYGTFAMIPLFLLWIYLGWMIVLAGAELVRALTTFNNTKHNRSMPKILSSLLVLWICWLAQKRGTAVKEQEFINAGLTHEYWQKLNQELQHHCFITLTQQSEFILTRDLSQLTLVELANTLSPASTTDETLILQELPWFKEIQKRLEAIRAESEQQFSITIANLFTTMID